MLIEFSTDCLTGRGEDSFKDPPPEGVQAATWTQSDRVQETQTGTSVAPPGINSRTAH